LPEVATRHRVILDLSRVRCVDLTGAHALRHLARTLADRGARLALCDLPPGAAGQRLQTYAAQLGLERAPLFVRTFPHLEDALEWAEGEIIGQELSSRGPAGPLALGEMGLLHGLPPPALDALEREVRPRALRCGERVFALGDPDSDLYLVRSGAVRLLVPLAHGKSYALATVAEGEFFGEMGFTDGKPRTAHAVARGNAEVYALSREAVQRASEAYPPLEMVLFARLSLALATQLRRADLDVQALKEL
jgi:SulP family sulfate permease